MVAAAKLKRAQINAEKTRPYAEKMRNVVYSLTKKSNQNNFKFAKKIMNQKKLLYYWFALQIEGLCGGFNGSIIKFTKKLAEKLKKVVVKQNLFL